MSDTEPQAVQRFILWFEQRDTDNLWRIRIIYAKIGAGDPVQTSVPFMTLPKAIEAGKDILDLAEHFDGNIQKANDEMMDLLKLLGIAE